MEIEYTRPIVGPLVGFAFVDTVVVGWMDLVVFVEAAMGFVLDVGFVSGVDSIVPLDFVVQHCFENLAAKTALYSEALLWRWLQFVDTTHEAAAFEDTPQLNRRSAEAADAGANTIFLVGLAGNLLPCRRALIRAATATSH